MSDLQNIERLTAEGKLDEAIDALGFMIAGLTPDADALDVAHLHFLRGKLYWRLGRRSEATSDFVMASSLNPDSPAVKALEQARDVDSFFNPDLYNP